jgi:maltose alpha-D-glucosyltransferase / alpha-amylase
MNELEVYIKQLYPNDHKKVVKELTAYIANKKKIETPYQNPYWHKNIDMYIIYPDGKFGRTKSSLQSLIPHLAHVKKLGCNAIHVLPFLDSPMVDKGFDIQDFYAIREDLGNKNDLKAFKKEADQNGIRVFMDLVFNHVSDQHEWFKKAVAGDEKYRNFFIVRKQKPHFIRKFHKASAVWGEYIVNNKKIAVNIAFPEHTGEIPHWRQAEDGYWYYHTYYPQQPDVNWKNPDLFVEFAKIVMDWAELGFNFRLDAIPFVGKSAYKEVDSESKFTYDITAAMNYIAIQINPECVYIAETYERINTIIKYFGNTNNKQAQLAYNFHLCTALWVSLVEKDVRYTWKIMNQLYQIPAHAGWINFLRNHDELSLAYLSDELKDRVNADLMKKGAPFREEYGVSGRTYSLLGRNTKRFLMSYFLLASLPGSMAIPYGDEIGKANIPLEKLSKQERIDSRNINRGILTEKEINAPKARKIFEEFAEIVKNRSIMREYLNVWPKRVKLKHKDPEIFAARYTAGISSLYILINLSDKSKRIRIQSKKFLKVAKINQANLRGNRVTLGPYGGIWLQR